MALATSSLAPGAEPQMQTNRKLSDFRDKNRVLLVFAPTAKDATYLEQMKLWHDAGAGFDERQLIVVPVLADGSRTAGESPDRLADRYGVKAGEFTVVLLGKDGHDAFRAAKPVAAESVYEKIDVMPMRRAEMKAQQAAHREQ